MFAAAGFRHDSDDSRLDPVRTAFGRRGFDWDPGDFRSHSDAALFHEAAGLDPDSAEASEGIARAADLYAEYRKAPEVTRKRIYLETMSEILPKVGSKIVVDDSVERVLPLLNLTGLGSQQEKSQ